MNQIEKTESCCSESKPNRIELTKNSPSSIHLKSNLACIKWTNYSVILVEYDKIFEKIASLLFMI